MDTPNNTTYYGFDNLYKTEITTVIYPATTNNVNTANGYIPKY